jgi:hypothetical protein
MSMRGCYRRVTVKELNEFLKDSSDIFVFLHPDDPADLPEDRFLDFDKSWAAIQFLLNGDVMGDQGEPPLSDAVLGGTWLGDVDVGYGPARYLLPQEVRAVATALDAIPEGEFRKRYDGAAMDEAGCTPEYGKTRKRGCLISCIGTPGFTLSCGRLHKPATP